MSVNPHGIHHVTAIARNPQQNVDFYTKVLGLRLVKQTVNFDAPHIWHLYYGDEQGSPASILTFFLGLGYQKVEKVLVSQPQPHSQFRKNLLVFGKSTLKTSS